MATQYENDASSLKQYLAVNDRTTKESSDAITNINRANELASSVLLADTPADETELMYLRDNQWIRQSFIVDFIDTEGNIVLNLEETDRINRGFSSASIKWTDSSLGGNLCINPPPAFTYYADVPDKGFRQNATDVSLGYKAGDVGMGPYYSEAIDDNNQIVHMRFGVPEYNSLWQFFTGFYSASAGNLARTGRVDQNMLEKFLNFGSGVITLAVFPLAIVPIAVSMVGSAVRFFMKWPSSKFYYLKPAMPAYWNAVTSLANQIGVNKGVINYLSNTEKESIIGKEHNFTGTEYSILGEIFPEFSSRGVIDVYAISNKSKRKEMRFVRLMAEQFEKGDTESWFSKVRRVSTQNGNVDVAHSDETTPFSLESYWQKFLDTPIISSILDGQSTVEKDLRQYSDNSNVTAEEKAALDANGYTPRNVGDGFWTFFNAELADGGAWASFRVDYTGAVQENFSNSVGESSLAQKINSASSSVRDLTINYAGGNIDPFGVTKMAVEGAGAILSGAASVLHIDGLAAMAGNAFVDIPKHWESSMAQLPKSTYTITLISPYGNAVSQMMSIYIPLAMLLAGALPLATGKQSHTAPFLCELYDRGRAVTRLGIIDSLTISRGTSNLGFNNQGHPMAIDVTFSVQDLSSIVAMPIQQGFSNMPLAGIFDGENSFSDYLMALSSMNMHDMNNRIPMLKYQLANKVADFSTFFSASHWGQVASTLPGLSMISAVMRGTEK